MKLAIGFALISIALGRSWITPDQVVGQFLRTVPHWVLVPIGSGRASIEGLLRFFLVSRSVVDQVKLWNGF